MIVFLSSCAPSKPGIQYRITGYWEAQPVSVSISCCLNEEMNAYAASLRGIFENKIFHCSSPDDVPPNAFRLDWSGPYYSSGTEASAVEATFWWDISNFMDAVSWTQQWNTTEPSFFCDDIDPSRWLVFHFVSYSIDTVSLSIHSSPKNDEYYVCPSVPFVSNGETECVAPPSSDSNYMMLSIEYKYASQTANL